MNPDDLVALNEEIAGMARAGLPLDQGLAALAREMSRGKLQKVTEALANDLRSGHTLAEALERQKSRLPPFYANLVTARIRTGRICEVLATMSVYGRMVAHVRSIVVDALSIRPWSWCLRSDLRRPMYLLRPTAVRPDFPRLRNDVALTDPGVAALGRHPLELIVLPLAVIVFGLLLAAR